MATKKQVQAAKRNVKSAQSAAKRKRTIANLPEATRRDLGKQASKARGRGGTAGHALEDRTREQLYELAKKRNVRGRSKMGKWDLIRALRTGGANNRTQLASADGAVLCEGMEPVGREQEHAEIAALLADDRYSNCTGDQAFWAKRLG